MLNHPTLADIAHIRHGFFDRTGGVSEGVYVSRNCGPGSDDNPDHVMANRAQVSGSLAFEPEQLHTLSQCHSSDVVVMDGGVVDTRGTKADALVTDQPGLLLGILTADCAPVLFADSTQPIIGAAHAGWKGAVGGVLENTVAEMYDLGARHADIVAVIGPCIGPESYEVGDEFRETFLNDDPENQAFFAMQPKQGHHMFDLPGYVLARLARLGLKSVMWVGEDTLPSADRYFSYRRTCLNSEPDYGRQISVIGLS